MKDSKRGDPMIRAIVFVLVFGLLEAVELWGDHLHHWHSLGLWRMVSDFFLLPIVIFVWLIPVLRPNRLKEIAK